MTGAWASVAPRCGVHRCCRHGGAGRKRSSKGRSNSPILSMSRSIGRISTAGPPTITQRRLRFFSKAAVRWAAIGRPGPRLSRSRSIKSVCARGLAAVPLEEEGARKFFEDNFRPLRISKLGDSEGFLTGYYEPIIEGSRVPTGEFVAPLYRRPPNLVVSGRRKLGDLFPSKGVKVGRRVGRRKIVPY